MQINANQVATASNDTTIKVWNVNTKILMNTFYGHSSAITTLAILPGGFLASGSSDQTVMVWNMATQEVTSYNMSDTVKLIKLHTTTPDSLLVSTCTSISIYIVSSGMNKTGTVATTASSINWLEVLAPSGNVLAVGSSTFRIYNFPSLTVNFTTSYTYGKIATIAKQLPDNLTVVYGNTIGALTLFNATNNSFGAAYTAHTGSFQVLELTPDCGYLISATSEGSVFIMWTWTTMSLLLVCSKTVIGQVYAAGFIPPTGFDGSKILFSYKLEFSI
jgi:WD40 repeat protein